MRIDKWAISQLLLKIKEAALSRNKLPFGPCMFHLQAWRLGFLVLSPYRIRRGLNCATWVTPPSAFGMLVLVGLKGPRRRR
jgi:hypothetical protein